MVGNYSGSLKVLNGNSIALYLATLVRTTAVQAWLVLVVHCCLLNLQITQQTLLSEQNWSDFLARRECVILLDQFVRSSHNMEGTVDRDDIVGPHIGPADGSDNGGDVITRRLDDGDEVTSMATPTLDERDGTSGPGKNRK